VNTPLTVSGLTLTPLGDGGFKLNGTSTAAGILIWNMSMANGGTSPTANQGVKTIPNGAYKFTILKTGLNTQVRGSNVASGGDNHIATSAVGEEFTIDDTYAYNWVRLQFENGVSFNNEVFYPMIRLSTETDASFAPYSNICPISGRTAAVVTRSDGDEISEDFTIQLGQTVYGADINWDTGVMTVNDISTTFDGSNDEGWSRYNQGSASAYAMQIDNTTGNSDTNVRPMTNGASGLNSSDTYGNYDCFISTSHGANWIAGRRGISTVEDWKAWLASNPIQVCYKLATPQTIQLTPTQLQMLKGYNRVTIDNGSIELGYIAKLT
jgi:hypothetical protein